MIRDTFAGVLIFAKIYGTIYCLCTFEIFVVVVLRPQQQRPRRDFFLADLPELEASLLFSPKRPKKVQEKFFFKNRFFLSWRYFLLRCYCCCCCLVMYWKLKSSPIFENIKIIFFAFFPCFCQNFVDTFEYDLE
jgi:hypothetical protein